MTNRESADAVRGERRRRRPEIGLDENSAPQRGNIEQERPPTLDELRRLRTDIYTVGSVKRQSAPAPRMLSAAFSRSSPGSSKSVSTKHRAKRSKSHRSEADLQSRRKRKKRVKDESLSQTYVYGPPKESRERRSSHIIPEVRALDQDDYSHDSDDSKDEAMILPVVTEESEYLETKPKTRKIKVVKVYVEDEKPRLSRHISRREGTEKVTSNKDRVRVSEKPLYRSHTTASRRRSAIPLTIEGLKRSSSMRELKDPRPVLKRSNTTSSAQRTTKTLYEPSIASTKKPMPGKQSGFLGLFTLPQKDPTPPRLVECLTCLSDDIPHSKSAKLKCGHRMCHSCLKRIFKLSVKDPQHMPPKCCTAEHIPLKHVERLFDIEFKKLWNKKFQEYTTKNRIYCPMKRCGEWIKPGNIHNEGGRKYGKCGRCKTKVCCLCNGKWHGNKDCPKDEETNALLEAAKKAGWQRCYSCMTMVELKEGCNHMTCRCTAEFCMICGLKWKSCNCPWFNYEQVEADRINHMRVPDPDRLQHMRVPEPLARARPRPTRPPRAYDEELEARRRQELQDEELARRMQVLGVDDDDNYNGRIGDINGVGNAGDHFMNQNFRRTAERPQPAWAAANYAFEVNRARGIPPPPPPPANPVLRRAIGRVDQYNHAPTTRPSERVVPRRTRHDYVSEAAQHAPLGVSPPRRSRPPRPVAVPAVAPRPSVLAGLVGTGRGSGRVGAWRAHVHPGVEPAEGVLSM